MRKKHNMSIQSVRKKIDTLDEKLIALLNQRARCSQKIGDWKRLHKKAVYAPDREAEVLARLKKLNKGPITSDSINAIYREIMSSSLSLEKKIRIAFLGPEYTFTHQASVKKFGQSLDYIPCASISDVFSEVENGRCDYGVAPVENSTEGAIYHTLDRFVDSDLKICSEITLKINLNILSKEKSLKKIRHIYSNPQVFGQCRIWLEANMPNVPLMPMSSTAHSARHAAKEKGAACIASIMVADPNKLNCLATSIQDTRSNTTRFLVLSRNSAKPTRNDKTSLLLSIKDKPGALQRVLEPFNRKRINLTKIESRPSKRKQWDYYFFIDIDSHCDQKSVRDALDRVKKECSFLRVLGSYPKVG